MHPLYAKIIDDYSKHYGYPLEYPEVFLAGLRVVEALIVPKLNRLVRRKFDPEYLTSLSYEAMAGDLDQEYRLAFQNLEKVDSLAWLKLASEEPIRVRYKDNPVYEDTLMELVYCLSWTSEDYDLTGGDTPTDDDIHMYLIGETAVNVANYYKVDLCEYNSPVEGAIPLTNNQAADMLAIDSSLVQLFTKKLETVKSPGRGINDEY